MIEWKKFGEIEPNLITEAKDNTDGIETVTKESAPLIIKTASDGYLTAIYVNCAYITTKNKNVLEKVWIINGPDNSTFGVEICDDDMWNSMQLWYYITEKETNLEVIIEVKLLRGFYK